MRIHPSRIPLYLHESDDPSFVAAVQAIVRSETAGALPEQLILVQIDNWFGANWLEFSGKVLGALGVWERDLTLPPFHPNRQLSQFSYRREDDGLYSKFEQLDLCVEQPSERNLNRKAELFSRIADSALLVWWSGNTEFNGRGSLLVYRVDRDGASGWYASLEKTAEWVVAHCRGESPRLVQQLIDDRVQ